MKFFLFCFLLSLAFISGCNQNRNKDKVAVYDTPFKGSINISVDESFEPVINEQIKIYEASNPDASIKVTYKSEADCFRDLQNDSVRLVIVARGLTTEESDYYLEKIEFRPQYVAVAYDAVSIVVNKNSKDSVFTLAELKKILSGETKKNVVVDGNNATSTVRYLLDSVLRGGTFGKNVVAAKGSKAVLDYISSNADAIGFVGSSWIGNDEDPEQAAYDSKLKFGLVECTRNCDSGTFAKPSQATLTYRQYPLIRPLYCIVKENTLGLGTGFLGFMTEERGQLIFRRAYLVPAKMKFNIRNGKLTDKPL